LRRQGLGGRVRTRVLALFAAVAAIAAIQQFLPAPARTLFWESVYDAGHFPLFGLLSLVVLALSRTLLPWPPDRHARHYVFAFGVSMLAGTVAELLQLIGPNRFGEFGDLVRNGLGIAVFLTAAATFDTEMVRRYRVPRHRAAVAVASALILAAVTAPVALAGAALVARDAAFPRLNGFSTYWDRKFLRTTPHVDLRLTTPPGDAAGKRMAEVTFYPSRNALLVLRDPYPDWTAYHRLVVDVFSALDRTVGLSIKIEDLDGTRSVVELFVRELTIEPGYNSISIPLSEIERAPPGRSMDMSHITGIALFVTEPPDELTLYLAEIRLE
jgi:hypothetical protein